MEKKLTSLKKATHDLYTFNILSLNFRQRIEY